jgi:hypothetical protein
MNFNDTAVSAEINFPAGIWRKILDSSEKKWNGAGSNLPEMIEDIMITLSIPEYNFCVYESEG